MTNILPMVEKMNNIIEFDDRTIGWTDVTHTFDRTKKYCRILRREEWKYKPGQLTPENYEIRPDEPVPLICTADNSGGFFFTDIQSVFCFLYNWGTKLCFVTVPEGRENRRQIGCL